MKEKNKPIKNEPDDLFREHLENRSFEFDESYWKDAEERIAAAEKSGELRYARTGGSLRRYFGWMLLGLIFILGTIEVIILSDNHRPSTPSLAQNNRLQETPVSPLNQDHTSVSPAEKTTNEIKSTHPNNDAGEENGAPKIKSRKHPLLNKALAESKEHNGKKLPVKEKSKIKKIVADASKEKVSDDAAITSTIEKNNTIESLPDSAPADSEADKIPADSNPLTDTPSENNVDATPNDPSSQAAAMAVAGINNLPVDTISGNNQDSLTGNTTGHTTFTKGDLRLYIGLEGGFDHSVPSLSSLNNDADQVVAMRNLSEAPANFISAGFIAGVQYHDLHMATGISRYSSGENADYSISQIVIDSTFSVVIDSGVIDTIWVMDTSSQQFGWSGTNQFTYYEIPLMVGYSFGKNDWRLNLETGVSFGFLATAGGKYPTTSLDGYTTISSADYSTTSVNWILAPSVEYAINEHFYVDVKAMMRWNLKSISTDPALDQKYKLYGLRLGINYRFGD